MTFLNLSTTLFSQHASTGSIACCIPFELMKTWVIFIEHSCGNLLYNISHVYVCVSRQRAKSLLQYVACSYSHASKLWCKTIFSATLCLSLMHGKWAVCATIHVAETRKVVFVGMDALYSLRRWFPSSDPLTASLVSQLGKTSFPVTGLVSPKITVRLKKSSRHFSFNFRKRCRIFIMYGTHVVE